MLPASLVTAVTAYLHQLWEAIKNASLFAVTCAEALGAARDALRFAVSPAGCTLHTFSLSGTGVCEKSVDRVYT